MRSSKDFEFLEHTADLRFRSYGKSLEECFQNAAKAMVSSMVNLESMDRDMREKIELKAETLEILLHDFLSEIVFLFETQNLLFSRFDVSLGGDGPYSLKAGLYGEKYDPEKHRLKVEIKAVTYHGMLIEKKDDTWIADVLCDI